MDIKGKSYKFIISRGKRVSFWLSLSKWRTWLRYHSNLSTVHTNLIAGGLSKGGSVVDSYFFRCASQTIWRKQWAFTWISQFWELQSAMFVPFIIVIKLSGVQFGLKSYVRFQNRVSTQCKFNLKSEVWF